MKPKIFVRVIAAGSCLCLHRWVKGVKYMCLKSSLGYIKNGTVGMLFFSLLIFRTKIKTKLRKMRINLRKRYKQKVTPFKVFF